LFLFKKVLNLYIDYKGGFKMEAIKIIIITLLIVAGLTAIGKSYQKEIKVVENNLKTCKVNFFGDCIK